MEEYKTSFYTSSFWVKKSNSIHYVLLHNDIDRLDSKITNENTI